MRTNQPTARAGVTRRRHTGGKQTGRTPGKTGYTVYSGIEDFLRNTPIASLNRYGERVISGTRIC